MKKNNKKEAYEIVKKLIDNGFETYLAGGCVRDELLNLQPEDYDVATSAKPEQVQNLFPHNADFAKKFGVISVIFKNKKVVEVSAFRKDFIYSDSRRPDKIEFGTVKDDYKRRDFTINALYKDIINNKIIDFCNGINDIKNKIIKTVGKPDKRFNEDTLRIIRALRFSGHLNFKIEKNTYNSILKHTDKLHTLSFERINEELTKMLTKKNAHICLSLLHKTGILKKILPEFEKCIGVEQPEQFHPEGDVYEHTLKMFELVDYPINKILAFSILLHDIGKPETFEIKDRIRFNRHDKVGAKIAESILRRLKFSNKEIRQIKFIVNNHMKFMSVQKMKKSKLQKLIFKDTFNIELELHRLDCLASHGKLDNYYFLLKKKKEFEHIKSLPKPLINGYDLIKLGLKPSSKFKLILDELYNKQLEGKFKTKKQGFELIQNFLNK